MIPDYQSLMLPALKEVADQESHRFGHIVESLANKLNLTSEERNEWLPAKTQRKFTSRVSWAMTYLKQAKLIERDGRGSCRITPLGLEVFNNNPEKIDNQFLRQFEEFREFTQKGKSNQPDSEIDVERLEIPDNTLSPDDMMSQGVRDTAR